MARFRDDIEKNKSITSIQAQPAREAVKAGSAKAGVGYFVVFTAPGATGANFTLETAIDPLLPDGAWKALGTAQAISTSAPAVYAVTFTDPAEVIRWRVTGSLSTTLVFSCALFLTDQ